VPTNPSTPINPSPPTNPGIPPAEDSDIDIELPLDDPPSATVPTTEDTTKPAPTPQGEDPFKEGFDIQLLSFEKYYWGMTPNQQKSVINLFATHDDFVKWYNAVRAQYKAEHPDVEIGDDGKVDLTP
jgi:hypothetical protein